MILRGLHAAVNNQGAAKATNTAEAFETALPLMAARCYPHFLITQNKTNIYLITQLHCDKRKDEKRTVAFLILPRTVLYDYILKLFSKSHNKCHTAIWWNRMINYI